MDNFIYNMETKGKKVIDITPLLNIFEAQEGEVQHIIGKTGMGKTYEATRRADQFLRQGYVVYTTWRLNLPEFYDQRLSFGNVLKNILLFRNVFYRFDYKKNWHYVNLDEYLDEDGIMDTEKLATFLATRTDCIFMLDEGQDVFDSHKRSGAIARQSITRTRHMHKTLIVISQRAQAVDVTVRGNITYFYKCEKTYWPLLGPRFRVRFTDEIDEGNNYPIWTRHDSQGREVWKAPTYHVGFAKKRIYDMYDSWYMRKQMIRSQDIHVEAYTLSFTERIIMLWRIVRGEKKIKIKKESTPLKGVVLENIIEKPKEKVKKLSLKEAIPVNSLRVVHNDNNEVSFSV